MALADLSSENTRLNNILYVRVLACKNYMKSPSSEHRSLQPPTPRSPVEAATGGPGLSPTVRDAIFSRNSTSSSARWSGDGVQVSEDPSPFHPKEPDAAGHKQIVETETTSSLSIPYTAQPNGSDYGDQRMPAGFAQPLAVFLAEDGPFEVKLKEVVNLRDRVVEKRVNIGNAETELERQRQYTEKAQNRFMKASRAFMASIDDGSSRSENQKALKKNWQLLQQSSDLFKSRGKRLRSAQHELQEWENTLLLKEEELYEDYLKKFLGAMSSVSSEETETQNTSDFEAVSAKSDSSDTMEPIVQQYYDRIGDVNILRERMYNFEGDHRRLTLMREAQRKEGLPIDPPEKEFYEIYFQEREYLARQYTSTKEDMYRLRSDCYIHGFHVEAPNLPPFLDQSYRIERSAAKKYSAPPFEGRFNPDVYLLFGHLDNKVRVARWISDVRQANQEVVVEMPESKLEATRHAIIKPLAPRSPGETSSWTDIEAEDYLRLPYYGQLQPSEADGLEKDGTELAFEKIQGDPPKRRYSEPNLPSFPRRPGDKMLKWHHTGHFEGLCKSCIVEKKAKSIS